MNRLLELSATELALRVRQKEVSPREVVEVHIQRCEEVNPQLNALCHTRFEQARQEARHAEKRVMAGFDAQRQPLLGVPFTVKETLALGGLPHTAGLISRVATVPDADAVSVGRMRAAGAIAIGKSNTSEMAMWIECHNRVFGRTNNPWDSRRTPGGSSGGEAALIASGASPMGLGSDAAGSIRLPASFCGVCGHKPTGGLLSGDGHFPAAAGDAALVAVVGPMARTVGDLRQMLEVLQGVDPTLSTRFPSPLAQLNDAGATIQVVDLHGMAVSDEVRSALRLASDALADVGLHTRTWSAPGLSDGTNLAIARLTRAQVPVLRAQLDLEGLGFTRIWWRFLTGQLPLCWPTVLSASMEALEPWTGGLLNRMAERAQDLQAQVERELGPAGLILAPCFGRVAPRHGRMVWLAAEAGFSAWANALHLPATTVPVGFSNDGLPIGVQVMGPRGSDSLTLAAAEVLEQALGGWQCARP